MSVEKNKNAFFKPEKNVKYVFSKTGSGGRTEAHRRTLGVFVLVSARDVEQVLAVVATDAERSPATC